MITIAANIGDTAILKYPACFPDSVVAIKPKVDELYIDYLNYYIKYVRDYLVALAPQAAQKNINLQQLSPTPVVIPPKEIQNEIVSKMDAAYNAKKQKEAEAQRLLNSIDNYLLNELGIELPEAEENTIQSRVFYRKLSDVSGGRFDPYYYKNIFLELLEGFKKSKYKVKTLNQLSESIINGYDCREFCEVGTLYLRVGNIRKYEFNIEDKTYIPIFEIQKDITLDKGDLLLTRKGSYGVSVVADEPVLQAVISSEIFRIRFRKSEKIIPYYISAFLNSRMGQLYFDRIKTGAIMGHISQEALRYTPIIIPTLEKQTEIANNITAIRNQAKQLQQEAKAGLEKAKKEVEAMILGEE